MPIGKSIKDDRRIIFVIFPVEQQVGEMYARVMVSASAAAAIVRVVRKGNTVKTVR
jgi:hypothetical protein